jgi:hypothetical protein
MSSRVLTARVISALAIATILAGHFISAARAEEVYLICIFSYFFRIASTFGLTGGYTGLLGVPILFGSGALMLLGLFFGIVLSLIILFKRNPGKILFRVAAFTYCVLGLWILLDLILVTANHNITDISGPDKINLSPFYFILPTFLSAFGVYYAYASVNSE